MHRCTMRQTLLRLIFLIFRARLKWWRKWCIWRSSSWLIDHSSWQMVHGWYELLYIEFIPVFIYWTPGFLLEPYQSLFKNDYQDFGWWLKNIKTRQRHSSDCEALPTSLLFISVGALVALRQIKKHNEQITCLKITRAD